MMTTPQDTEDRLTEVIWRTLSTFGVRLPVGYSGAGIDERIELMTALSRHVARAVVADLDAADRADRADRERMDYEQYQSTLSA